MTERAAAQWYDANAGTVTDRYERLSAAELFSWATDLLPGRGALALDVGAGTSRDATWLASQGIDVVAVEPSAAMRLQAATRHPDASVRWVDDTIPSLAITSRLGLTFDLIALSAVWQHVPLADRPRAFCKLNGLLKPGGLLLFTVRLGADDDDRMMHEVSVDELEALARMHGMVVVRTHDTADKLGRPELRWTAMALRLPDDGTGALPLMRHVILNDNKSSTYKLALLRALCRIADGSSGLIRDDPDAEHVGVPLGLVALAWVRLFLPLLRHNLPQSVKNTHAGEALGFAKNGFRALLAAEVRQADLQPGAVLPSELSSMLDAALAESAKTISEMPARYTTYPGGDRPVFPVLPWVAGGRQLC